MRVQQPVRDRNTSIWQSAVRQTLLDRNDLSDDDGTWPSMAFRYMQNPPRTKQRCPILFRFPTERRNPK